MKTQRSIARQATFSLSVAVLLVLSLGAVLAQGPAGGRPASPTAGISSLVWDIQRVDAPHQFLPLGDRRLAVDSAGHPHIAYGSDFLYYAWHDGTSWHIETVDDSPLVGRSASLRLDGVGRPHIAYYDQTRVTVKYAYHDGTAWRVATVDRAGPFQGTMVALALDAAGQPYIAYCSASGDPNQCEELRYASLSGTTWLTATVDDSGLGYWQDNYRISLELDASSLPHVAYYNATLGTLQHAYYDGVTWHVETVGNYIAEYVSLALDAAGQPRIGFRNGFDYSLNYAHYDGTAWSVESVHDLAGEFLSLTLDPLGRPHISHTDSNNVLYTYYDGAAWQTQTVTVSCCVWYTAIALDLSGQPHISYGQYDISNYHCVTLEYAHYDGTAWQLQTVDRDNSVGDTSLALDALGRPHIGYDTRELRYASSDGAAWQIQTVDSAGDDVALALDNAGLPHIAYEVNDSLRHAWFDGMAWFTETAPISWPWSISLDVDTAGQPHVSYIGGSGNVEYAWYDGTTWHHETAASGWASAFPSLALDAADRPHIAYAYGLSELRYAHLSETVWITETADSTDGAGFYASLALDAAGRPHIGHCVANNPPACNDLRYAWFDGTAWHTATVESAGDVGGYASLALDAAGRPHLSYCLHKPGSTGCDELRYAWFDGTTWFTATVDSDGDVGRYTSLALDAAGRPHISYTDGLGDLKYAHLAERYRVYLPLVLRATASR